jgi:cytoskeletal protein CcmA (bactofilin family)
MFARRRNPETRSGPSPGEAVSIIAAGLKIKGGLEGTSEVRIDGSVEGDIKTARVTVGETGLVKGNLDCETALIEGTVTGQIKAKSAILARTAKVTGDVVHATLTVEPGASVDGHCRKLEEPLRLAPAPKAEVAPGPGGAEGISAVVPTGAPFPPLLGKMAAATAGLALLVLAGMAGPDWWSTKASTESGASLFAPVAAATSSEAPKSFPAPSVEASEPSPVGEANATPLPEPPKPAPTAKAARERAKPDPARPATRTAMTVKRSHPSVARVTPEAASAEASVPAAQRSEMPVSASTVEEPGWFQPAPPLTRQGTN